MSTIRSSLVRLTIFTLACVLGSGGCGDDANAEGSGETIRIGVFIREGGDSADEILAARDINNAGGIKLEGKSYPIELVRMFDGASAAGGVRAVDSFVEQGAVAAVGPRWSSILLGDRADHSDGAAHAAIEEGLLLVSSSATSAEITTLDDDDLIWRTVPSDDIQGLVGARYSYETAGARTAAILYRDDAWGRGLSATFAESFEELGGTIVASESYDSELDFAGYAFPELDALFEDKPDLVYMLAFDEFLQLSHRVVQGGYLDAYGDAPPRFLVTDGAYDHNILSNGPPEVLARLSGTVPGPSPTEPTYAEYVDYFVDAGLGPAENAWPYAYDAVYIVALAIQAAQSLDSQDFKDVMRDVSHDDGGDVELGADSWADAVEALENGEGIDYDGPSGPLEFTPEGDPSTGRISIWEVARDDDEFVFDFDEANDFEFDVN